MRYDVTSKNLAKKIKKDGTTSKVNDIKATYKAGNIIVTYFGEFVSVGVEQIIHTSSSGRQYKQYMVTLKDSRGTYKMTHNQAHKNKKMPKSAKVEQVVIAGLLPAPEDPLDYYVSQCINIKNNFNNGLLSDPNNYTRKNTLKRAVQRRLINDEPPHSNLIGQCRFGGLLYTVEDYYRYQVYFICNVYNAIHDQNTLKQIKHELIRSYHPDTNTYFANPIKLHIVKNIYIDNEEEWVC